MKIIIIEPVQIDASGLGFLQYVFMLENNLFLENGFQNDRSGATLLKVLYFLDRIG